MPRTLDVSVIIPTHNRRAFVVEAVESVLDQRGCRTEIIVVDDGSDDDTARALGCYGSRIRYVYQEQRGVAAARNAGARRAHAPWLAFLDSDDLWLPGKLAAQIAFHDREQDIPVSQTEEIWLRNGVRVNPRRYHRKPSGDIFAPSLWRCLVSPSAAMIRKDWFDALGGFDSSLTVCEDYDLWLRLAVRARVGLVAEPLVVKRGGHADQLSRRFWGMDRFRVAALVKLLAGEEVRSERRRLVIETLSAKCAILAKGAARRGRMEESARYLALARYYRKRPEEADEKAAAYSARGQEATSGPCASGAREAAQA